MHPHHDGKKFLVPRRDEAPEVGVVAEAFTERIEDEIAELAQALVRRTPLMDRDQLWLERFGAQVVDLLKRRAEADVADFAKPLLSAPAKLTREQVRRLVAAELGRVLDWICKKRRVPDMGPRAFAVASHIRASAVDHRTDQEAALEMGNDSRASIAKMRSEFRRDLGADYPGENGKASNTKAKCKTSRIAQLKN